MAADKALVAVVVVVLVFSLFLTGFVNGQSGLNLEAEQNWDTYGVGGTCTYNTQNLYVGDVDGDGASEILTGGFAYHTQDGARISMEAPLKVWSWNGQNVTLKASATWNGSIYCLYATDIDKDGITDIICGGSYRNDTGRLTSSLRIFNLINGQLELKAHYEGIAVNSLFVSDVDKDGINDLLTVGRHADNSSQLSIWHVEESNLLLDQTLPLTGANVTSANSVYTSDLDNDGAIEVLIGGYSDSLANSNGLVSVWYWNGQEFSLEAVNKWQLGEGTAKTIAGASQGNTAVNNVKAADLDGDGNKEVVTAGFAFDGQNVNAQIKVWRWDTTCLTELASKEWATDYLTEAKSIALNDVNGDGKVEIVQSGIAASKDSFNNPEGVHDRAQIRIWSFNGTGISLVESRDWTFDEGACAWNVGSGDVDNDGIVEMVTVGCTALKGNCDPDMRIWSLPVNPSYLPYVIGGTVVLACVCIGLIYFKKQPKPGVH